MARFPIIDSPCPLGKGEQADIDGHCGHCGKTVHSLDGMDDAGRSIFMREAKGPVCVSYRLPVGIGAAMALSLAGPVFAQGVAHEVASTQQAATSAQAKAPETRTPQQSPLASPPKQLDHIEIFMGGVHEPSATKWTEDMSLPELPTAQDDTLAE